MRACVWNCKGNDSFEIVLKVEKGLHNKTIVETSGFVFISFVINHAKKKTKKKASKLRTSNQNLIIFKNFVIFHTFFKHSYPFFASHPTHTISFKIFNLNFIWIYTCVCVCIYSLCMDNLPSCLKIHARERTWYPLSLNLIINVCICNLCLHFNYFLMIN